MTLTELKSILADNGLITTISPTALDIHTPDGEFKGSVSLKQRNGFYSHFLEDKVLQAVIEYAQTDPAYR